MRLPLSPRQREVYAAIVNHWAEHAMSPTYAELMDATGINWTNGMRNHVAVIRSKGWLTPQLGNATARDMVPTDLAETVKQAAGKLRAA